MSVETTMQPYLKDISPDKIERNPQNPRLFFRPEEMDTLMASIRRYGIQVPIVVYEDKNGYVLIDGERRWRCALKLNLRRIPALIQQKPSPLQNLLLMYNIHALREQWDYLTIASKLPDVVELFRHENLGREPNETELSEITGLTRGQIRRCRFLLDLPERYKELLQKELTLPKHRQQLSEDFFIEMERALKTVQARIPTAVKNANTARDALISKFRGGLIGNITDFRKLSKIATSISNLGVKEAKARSAITDILDPHSQTSIAEVYAEQFEMRYDERKVSITIDSISEFLEESVLKEQAAVSEDLRTKLLKLERLIEKVLGS
jgi:ParB family chromosome partitioning protein